MPINQSFLGEFDYETAATRKTLERIPEDKFGWKPHPKSTSLGALANHLADVPGWVKDTLEKDSVDVAGYQPSAPGTRADILAKFDKNVAAAKAALQAATDDARFMQPWALKNGGNIIFSMPKVAVLRSFVFNHNVHHRAQLGVYLRLNNVPVPSIYGPSADEGKI